MAGIKNENLHERVIKILIQIRKDKELSHDNVAEKSGLSRRAIGFIEAGERKPTLLTCFRICEALDVNLEDVIISAKKK